MNIKSGSQVFRKINILVRRKFGPIVHSSKDGVNFWRERIFHYFSLAFILIGSIVFLFYGWSFFQADNFEHLIFTSFVFVSSLLASTVSSLPLKFRIRWILLMVYLVGVYVLLESHISALGLIFLLAYSLMAAILLGSKGAIRSVFFNLFSLIAIGFVYYFPFTVFGYVATLTMVEYVNMSIAFMVANLVSLSPLVSLLNGLMFSLKRERRLRKILRQEHEDLTLAKKKAVESDQLKTAFLSNISHEIHTPMTAIMGYSNLLMQTNISAAEKHEFIDLINLNGKNLMTLVEDIIDISKIESRQLKVKNAPCQLHILMRAVYDSFAKHIDSNALSNLRLYLKEGISEDSLVILTDGHRLNQILRNLVGNAIKFTECGSVEFGYEVIDDHTIQFHVKDTGIGLPAGKENEIFDHFSKFNDDNDRLYGGTGIGLSIAKHLIELMGGQIWVNSKHMVGTTFFFTLPFHRIGSR